MLSGRRTAIALKHANALVEQGRFREAIDQLTRANRARRNHEIERRLVSLRSEACEDIDDSHGLESWPPAVDDAFPDAEGIVEIHADELSVETLRSGILKHGCLLVRGLIREERVARLVAAVDRAFEAHDASTAGSATDTPWYVPFDPGPRHPEGLMSRSFVRDGGGVLAVDSPPTFFEVVEAFDECGLRPLITDYLSEPPMLLAAKLTLRRVSPSEDPHPDWDPVEGPDWHQDGAFMGVDVRSVDVWLALSHCGRDAPGLDVVPRRFEEIVETGTEGAHFDWSVGHGAVRRIADGNFVRPVFAPGDALIFDHLLLHRTAIDSTMPNVRHAIEAWFAAPSSYPMDQVPIAY